MSARVPPAYRALIGSGRVSARTRAALLARATPDDPAYTPQALSPQAFATLRAAVDRIVPQSGAPPIDLAARIDALLAAGQGDGWRYDHLPPDLAAARAGLETLDQLAQAAAQNSFAALAPLAQDAILTAIAAGQAARPGAPLDARQMQSWFEELRADAVRAYVSHPATLARLGYSGLAYGGDGEPKSGFTAVGLGETESWEPAPAP